VLLMDADLRRPSLHRRLGLDNLIGLSQIFVHPELGMSYSLQPTRIHGLTVITSGDTPPNPSELLGSQIMGNLMEEVRNNFDIVLIDTPPALAVTDAAVLLQFVDGVLLVIKPGVTNMAPLRRLIHQFHLMNANLLGGVLNDINIRNSTYGYYYRQYKYYNDYSRKNEKKQVKKKSSNHNQHTFKDKAMKSMVRQAIRMLTLLTNKL
jgi:succinoglycan biosynthesis transport protein ExoP